MRTKLVALFTFALIFTLASCKEHLHHDEHGEAKVKLITDERALSIEFSAHTEPIIGFEHEAKTPAEKEKQATALGEFEKNFPRLFQLPGQCKFTKQLLQISKEGHHAIFESQFNAECETALKGQALDIMVGKFYPDIKEVKIEWLQQGETKTMKVAANGRKIQL